MMESSDLQALIGAASGAAASLGLIARYLSQQRELKGGNLMEARHYVYETLHALRDVSRADRVSMVKLANSGGVPVVGEDWHATVYAEVPARIRAGEAFDGEVIDEHATDVVWELRKTKKAFLSVGDMPRDSLLKRFYSAFGVFGVGKLLLYEEKGCIWLLALNYFEEEVFREVEAADNSFFAQMGVLRALLRKHRRLREQSRLRG